MPWRSCLLGVALTVALGGPQAATPAVCNGLLAFTSNRTEDALPEIYSLSLDGARVDVSRTIAPDASPQPSPDGRRIAFWSGGALVVADVDGSNPQRLPAGAGAAFQPGSPAVWAPNSQHLAVAEAALSRAYSGRVIVVYDLATGAVSELGEGHDPVWSPDGSALAFDDVSGIAATIVRPDGASPPLSAPGTGPLWSPDGTRLLLRDSGGSAVVAVNGGARVELPGFGGLAWAPDGTRLVGAGPNGLESIGADGTAGQVIGGQASLAALAPDGRKLAYTRGTDNHLVVTDLAGNLVRDLGTWPPAHEQAFSPPPRWSPDSTNLLLWSGGKVVVVDLATGAARTLAGSPTETTDAPVWSADGSSVYDAVTDTRGNTDVYVANPDGSGVRQLFGDSVPEVHPVWSPDGTRLAFIRLGSPASLVVVDAGGRARTVLSDPGLAGPDTSFYSVLGVTGLGPPAWSPDSRTIAVASNFGITLVDARTGRARIRWPSNLYAFPAFSPSGQLLAFAMTNMFGGEDVVVAPLNGNGRRWAVHAGEVYGSQDEEPGVVEDIAWSRNGRRLSFVRFARGEYGDFGFQTRILDTRTHRVVDKFPGAQPTAVSPDGRFTVDAGFDTVIRKRSGRVVDVLRGLRAAEVSWQPLCRIGG